MIINEVAWMGTENSTADEWMELFNNGSINVDLSGWQLNAQDGAPTINLEGIIPANSFFLLERTDDNSAPTAAADLIYTGALSNSGEILILRDASGVEIDRADGSGDWQIGGNNDTKETLQRTAAGWITATATPRLTNAGQPQLGESAGQINQPPIPEFSGSIVPLENSSSIKALAGPDKTAVAGAEIEFKGEAYGLKNEPLENARYLWIFGDGTQKEGKTARHAYYFPGVYQAVLNVSSGYYSASDYLKIIVIPNELYISEIKPASGNSSWIEIHNPSTGTLDISHWVLKSRGKKFIFPDSTYILAKSFLAVPESVSAISLALISGEAELLYPTGFSADLFSYNGLLKENESFNRIGGQIIIASESPGKENNNSRPPSFLETQSPSLSKNSSSSENKSPNIAQSANIIEATRLPASLAQADGGQAENKAAEDTKNNVWFWFLASLGMGILSAAGFIFLKTNQER